MNQIQIFDRVAWKTNLEKDWTETFYPSLVKDIKKSDNFFSGIFEIKFLDATKELLDTLFFPVYNLEIASREAYAFEHDEQRSKIFNRIDENFKYKLMAVYLKETGEFVGGTLYGVLKNHFSIALRAFKRDINKTYKSSASLDYWADSKLYQEAKNSQVGYMYHGADIHPVFQRIGLPVFKLNVGAKPFVSSNKEFTLYSKEDLTKSGNLPSLYFENPDENKYYRNAKLHYKEGEINEHVFKSLKNILNWAGITLEIDAVV